MKTIQQVIEYNAHLSPGMKFRTSTGRERITGYVVTIDGYSQWVKTKAEAEAINCVPSWNEAAYNYDPNS